MRRLYCLIFTICALTTPVMAGPTDDVAQGSSTPVARTSSQEDRANYNSNDDKDANGESATFGNTDIRRPITAGGGVGTALATALDRGKEADWTSLSYYTYAEIRGHVGDAFGIRWEVGGYAGYSRGRYTQKGNFGDQIVRFQADQDRLELGARVYCQDNDTGADDPASWEFTLDAGLYYMKTNGKVGRGSGFAYRAKQEEYGFQLNFRGSLLFPFYGYGSDTRLTRVRGRRPDGVPYGFMPKVELRLSYWNSFSTHRRTTATRLGGHDPQRNYGFSVELRPHIWRWVNETNDIDTEWLWETDFFVIGHYDAARSYGAKQIRDEHFRPYLGGGCGFQVVLNRFLYASVEGQVWWGQRGMDNTILHLNFNLGVQF